MDELEQIGANSLELGTALHSAVGGISDKDPIKISQIQEIAEFFNNHPDAVETMGRVSRSNSNPNLSNLEHLTTYVLLSKKRMGIMDSLENINNELKYYG